MNFIVKYNASNFSMLQISKTLIVILFSTVIFVGGIVFAEREPDMKNPGIEMFFCGHLKNAKTLQDCLKNETYENYPWYGKINVMIFAPAWNEDPNEVEVIGNTDANRIGAYTDVEKVNGPCEFEETGPNTGVFLGRVKLTGFKHDADGTGKFGIKGGTSCNPTNKGAINEEALSIGSSREGRITVFWEYNEDQVILKSASYGWRIGTLEFDKKTYLPKDTVKVKFYDVDVYDERKLNLDLRAYSDSDTEGLPLDVYYKFGTSKDPGITFELTNENRGPNKLFVTPGDNIYIEYIDRTLPRPYAESDDLEIVATAKVAGISLTSFSVSDITFKNTSDEKITNPFQVGEKIIITNDVKNELDETRSFASIIQVKDSEGKIIHVSWQLTSLPSKHATTITHTWVPKAADTYLIETYVWDNLLGGLPLAEMKQKSTIVK